MNTPAPSTPPIARSGQSSRPGTHLDGRWLVIARVTWCVVAGLVGALFIASILPYFAYLHTLTTGVVVDLNAGQLTPAGVRALQTLGLSVDFYALYHLVLNAVFLGGFLTVGSVLFWHKADDRMALFTSFTLVTFPIGFLFQITTLPSAWVFWVHSTSFLSGMGFCLFFYLFPNGRFVPRWTAWLLIGWVVEEGSDSFFPLPAFYYAKNVLLFALLVSLVAAQVYRYRRVSTPLERHQTRWVVFGFLLAIAGFLGVIILGTFFPALRSTWHPRLFCWQYLHFVVLALDSVFHRDRDSALPALGHRYSSSTRHWSMASLTGAAGCPLRGPDHWAGEPGRAVRRAGGHSSPVVLVISTLAIAALFLPVRRRIQHLIDRRFYRHRSMTRRRPWRPSAPQLRQEVDLEQMREQLLAVVQRNDATRARLALAAYAQSKVRKTRMTEDLPQVNQSQDHPSTPTLVRFNPLPAPDHAVVGQRLLLARVLWLAVLILVLGLFIASIPTYFAYLHTTTTGIVIDLNAGQLALDGVRELHALGLSVDFYALYHLVLDAIFAGGFWVVGSALFWRKAEHPMALFTSFALLIFPITFLYQTTTLPAIWSLPTRAIDFLGGISFSLVFSLFPNGRFVPGWTRWLLIGWVLEEGIESFLPLSAFYYAKNVLLFALLVSLVAAQVYRYRRVSTSLERLQTRWVMFGFTLAIVGFLGVILPGTFFPARFQPGTLVYFVGNTAMHLFLFLSIPFSFGFAMLRYRLWDIDLLINRTLVYGLLTVLVVGLYVLVVGFPGTLCIPGMSSFLCWRQVSSRSFFNRCASVSSAWSIA